MRPSASINAAPKIWEYENRQITGNLTSVRGKHSMKFGVDFLRYDYLNDAWNDTRGRVAAQGAWTGHPVADFMLGYLQSTRRTLAPDGPHDRVYNFSTYFQDDFRVTSTLTLNLGLRYDRFNQPVETRGAMANFIPRTGRSSRRDTGTLTPEQFNSSIAQVGLAPYVAMASDVGLPDVHRQARQQRLRAAHRLRVARVRQRHDGRSAAATGSSTGPTRCTAWTTTPRCSRMRSRRRSAGCPPTRRC